LATNPANASCTTSQYDILSGSSLSFLQTQIEIHQQDNLVQSQIESRTSGKTRDRDLTTREWSSICFWSTLAICAIAFHLLVPSSEETVDLTSQRDSGWDIAKVLFMWSVLVQHVFIFWLDASSPMVDAMAVFCMPGFSMVSGVFATSFAVRDPSTGKISIGITQLQRSFCDLAIINVTMYPWYVLARTTSRADLFDRLGQIPILLAPDLWYLGCLFLWLLLTPLLVAVPCPRMTTLFVYLFVGVNHKASRPEPYRGLNLSIPSPSITFLPFFVFGFFVLGGGGLPPEGRKEQRRLVQARLQDWRTRILAILALAVVAWISYNGYNHSMSHFLKPKGVTALPSQWSDGGIFTAGLSLLYCTCACLALLSLAFMIPPFSFLCHAGSHTLYSYVLSEMFGKGIIDPGLATALPLMLPSLGKFGSGALGTAVALLITLVLSSRFVVMLFRPFVQPRWLISLMEHMQLRATLLEYSSESEGNKGAA